MVEPETQSWVVVGDEDLNPAGWYEDELNCGYFNPYLGDDCE
jgi:hypothetical protein